MENPDTEASNPLMAARTSPGSPRNVRGGVPSMVDTVMMPPDSSSLGHLLGRGMVRDSPSSPVDDEVAKLMLKIDSIDRRLESMSMQDQANDIKELRAMVQALLDRAPAQDGGAGQATSRDSAESVDALRDLVAQQVGPASCAPRSRPRRVAF